MGIYGALSTAVTGLRAQSFALENISGNIANSQTTGYKRVETDFLDLIPDAPLKRQTPGAVLAQSRGTNNLQGDIKTSGTETFMALNGSGFFVVEPKIGQSDGNPVFAGSSFYTRRGDFELDKGGFLVNGAGYYLKGLPIDTSTGNVSGSVPEVIRLSNAFLPAQETNRIDYALNLPELPKNRAYDPTVTGSELMDVADYDANGNPRVSGDGIVMAKDNDTFINQSTAGGAITVYAPNGAPVNMQLRWAKVESAASGTTAGAFTAGAFTTVDVSGGADAISFSVNVDGAGAQAVTIDAAAVTAYNTANGTSISAAALTAQDVADLANDQLTSNVIGVTGGALTFTSGTSGATSSIAVTGYTAAVTAGSTGIANASDSGTTAVDTWNLFYLTDSTATATDTMWKNAGVNYTFSADGSMNPVINTTSIAGLTINGVAVGDIDIQHGANGVTQFADADGTAAVSELHQNGYGAGQYLSVNINDAGRVVASYSNGQQVELAQVVVANFNAVNQLKRFDGGVFGATSESGEAILGDKGGIIGSSLESSNTDISEEFTKLIVTQQAYAAGTRIVTTANEMLQQALNMIR